LGAGVARAVAACRAGACCGTSAARRVTRRAPVRLDVPSEQLTIDMQQMQYKLENWSYEAMPVMPSDEYELYVSGADSPRLTWI